MNTGLGWGNGAVGTISKEGGTGDSAQWAGGGMCVCVGGGGADGKGESAGEERDREREPDVGGQQSTSVRCPRLGSELGCENRQLPSPVLKESLGGRRGGSQGSG